MSIGRHGQLHERLPAQPESIARLRHAIVEFAADSGASDGELEDIALAVSEALTNVVLHAYAGRDRPGVMAVEARVRERRLEVVVGDEGVGMRPRADSPGLGHGLAVIHRIAEQLQIEDATPGVRIRMAFAIGWG